MSNIEVDFFNQTSTNPSPSTSNNPSFPIPPWYPSTSRFKLVAPTKTTSTSSAQSKPSSSPFGRIFKPNSKYANIHTILANDSHSINEPLTFDEAINSPKHKKW